MTEINCFDVLPDSNVTHQELESALPQLKNYIENLYTGFGKIEDLSKLPIVAFFSDRIDKIEICIISKLSKKYKEHIDRINKEIKAMPLGSLSITLENGKNIVLGQPEQFSAIEANKLHEVIDQFGGDDDSKKKKNRFNTLTTKGSFFDDKYPYDDLLFNYDGNGILRRAMLYYTGPDGKKKGYQLDETEYEIASLFAKQLHMKDNGDKGYFSDKATGKTKKTDAQKRKFIDNFWAEFTKGKYCKRVIKQPCKSCDGKLKNKFCWAKSYLDFITIKQTDYQEYYYMSVKLRKIFKLYDKTDFNEFVRQIDLIAEKKVEDREFKKGDSPDKIALRKQDLIDREEKKHNRGYAFVDGRREPLGKVTPMLLRLFTGAKSKLYSPGQITARVEPEDCVLNICGGNIPKPPPGRCWGAVICDPTVKIVVWYKPIFLRDGVVKVLSDGEITFGDQSLISSKDKLFKFEKARKLNKNIQTVRSDYEKLLQSTNKEKQQIGVVVYLLDRYGFRGGSDEDKDSDKEEDGIGVTTLQICNIKEITPDSIHLNFKGKSGIEFDEKIDVPIFISELIQTFIAGRSPSEKIFNLIDLDKVNNYLHSIDKLFSAKVFRTRLASGIMFDCLETPNLKINQGDDKKETKNKFDGCNLSVALALNHKKKATEKQEEKLNGMKEEIELLKKKKPVDKKLIKQKEEIYKHNKQLWEVSITTSLKNYIDPRIVVSWAKQNSIDWDDNFDGKNKTVNTLDDLYLIPQIKFVKAKTEDDSEDGGAVKNAEFIWAIESVNETWNWDLSPLLIENILQPETESSNPVVKPKSVTKTKPVTKPNPVVKPKSVTKTKPVTKPKPFAKPKLVISDSSSDSDDDKPIYTLIKKKKNVGTEQDFKLLLEICENPTPKMKRKIKQIDKNVIKWLYPFCIYALNTIPDPPEFNFFIVKVYDIIKQHI